MKNGLLGAVLGILFVAFVMGFTNVSAPARHFASPAAANAGVNYVTTVAGDPNNTGVPIPANQLLGSGVIPTGAFSDGGTSTPYFEFGIDVMSTGTKTVTFKNAFTVIPSCFCTDGTALTACDAPLATIGLNTVVFNGTGSDKFSWFCVGGGT